MTQTFAHSGPSAVASCEDESVIRAIIGEAEGEGLQGMKAVAHAIRNRGTLAGVYGARSRRIDVAPEWLWEQAVRAWYESAEEPDITNGATHWESVDFPTPKWARGMRKTKQIGKHIFYEPISAVRG